VGSLARRHETRSDRGGDLLIDSPAIAWDLRHDSGTPPAYHPAGHNPRGSRRHHASPPRRRPHRRPHGVGHDAALLGAPSHHLGRWADRWGEVPMPGEVSLAHTGVPFLDELSEFCGYVLERMCQPLEESVTYLQSRGRPRPRRAGSQGRVRSDAERSASPLSSRVAPVSPAAPAPHCRYCDSCDRSAGPPAHGSRPAYMGPARIGRGSSEPVAEAIMGETGNQQPLASQSIDPLMEGTIGWRAKDSQV
jgi:Magnesium chelatase, subunit ChlI